MSWQLGAFAILAVGWSAGSRGTSARALTRESSRSSATLAAFAALGRIAFAALPNVKPTTDIVLIVRLRARRRAGFASARWPG